MGGGLILAILIWSCKENLDFRIQTDSKETVIKKFQDALDTKRSTIHYLLSKRNMEYSCWDDEDEDCSENLNNPFTMGGLAMPTSWGGCSACISVDIYTCYDPVNGKFKRIAFDNFQAYPDTNDVDCDDVLERWEDYEDNSQYSLLDAEMDEFYLDARDAAEEYLVDALMNTSPSKYRCGATNGAVSSEFYTTTCYRWCILNTSPFQFSKALCGSICCMKVTEWCLDSNGDPMPGTPTYDLVGSSSCTYAYESCMVTLIGSCDHSNTCEP